MKANSLYELLVEDKHIDIIISALSNYIHSQYEGVDSEIVDIPVTLENIKIASDIQLVLKHTLGSVSQTIAILICIVYELREIGILILPYLFISVLQQKLVIL